MVEETVDVVEDVLFVYGVVPVVVAVFLESGV